MLTNHQRCIFKPDCFIVRLIYNDFVHFPSEPTQSPQVGLVHTFALNPGVMWEPASHRSGWFGRLRPLTRGGGPPSLTFESRRISRCASLTPRPPCRADVSLDSSAKPLARLSGSAQAHLIGSGFGFNMINRYLLTTEVYRCRIMRHKNEQ